MKDSHKVFLNLLFDKDETICVSDCQGGYHSVKQSDLEGDITLVSPVDGKGDRVIKADRINLVAINPINGYRRDSEVTAFRSFLMELDDGALADQKIYIDNSGLPYSICIFSGNKSLHYGVVLDKPLASKAIWQQINLWILAILSKADQQCKNPSRSIRFPDVMRRGDLGKEQKLIEIKERISKDSLYEWLNKHPECKPKKVERSIGVLSDKLPDIADVPAWVKEKIDEGVTFERNNTFLRMAGSLAKRGFTVEEVKSMLMRAIVDDFKESELDTTINSAFKNLGE